MAVQMGSDSGCGVPKLRPSLNLILIGEDGPFRERRAERRTEQLQSGAGSNRPGLRIVHPPAVRHCRRAARRGLRKPLKITTLTGHSSASTRPCFGQKDLPRCGLIAGRWALAGLRPSAWACAPTFADPFAFT